MVMAYPGVNQSKGDDSSFRVYLLLPLGNPRGYPPTILSRREARLTGFEHGDQPGARGEQVLRIGTTERIVNSAQSEERGEWPKGISLK